MGTDYIIYCVVLLTDPPLMEIYIIYCVLFLLTDSPLMGTDHIIYCVLFIDRSSSDGDRSYNILCVVLLTDQEQKNIIDKLANFVARNGSKFEEMTKEKQKENKKFGFLFGGEYYNYYKWRVSVEIGKQSLFYCFHMHITKHTVYSTVSIWCKWLLQS